MLGAMERGRLNNVVAVIGMGTMGRKIAELCLANGFHVIASCRTAESSRTALERLSKDLTRKVERGKISHENESLMLSRFRLAEKSVDLAKASIVIEAVNEDIHVKKEAYKKIEEHILNEAILATNTSSLSVTELGNELAHPERFIGLHFFNPPDVMRLVEVRRGARTSNDIVEASTEFARKMGRTPIMVPDEPGYYVNRILFPMIVESILVLDSNDADPKDVDDAMKLGANHPMGPFELCDFIGNDVVLKICEILYERTHDPRFEPPSRLIEMVRLGKLGRKSGEGFYKY
jgi:3-hydroxybutyryl-CoA dehydrogenase